jgi:uncharacterized protein
MVGPTLGRYRIESQLGDGGMGVRAGRVPALSPRAVIAALAVLAGAAAPALALEVPPRPEGRVSDYAHLLSPAAAGRIESMLARHEAESSDQIAVAIFRSLEGEALEDFSIRLAEQWKIGTREHSNGVILVIFADDRRTRLEVGYGLEGRLTDALSDRILRQVLAPRFRTGDFDGGVEAAMGAIIQVVQGEYQGKGRLPEESSGGSAAGALGGLLFIIVLIAILTRGPSWIWWLILGNMLGGGRGGWSSHRSGGFGGFGGGGGGGSFGGGGGSFGGGGSSGSW